MALLAPLPRRLGFGPRLSLGLVLPRTVQLKVQSHSWKTKAQQENVPQVPASLEECELVSGIDITLDHEEDDDDDAMNAHLVKAVKNNNGLGVVLLSDVLGFDNPETKDFAYRLACFGYNVLIPDLFRGFPWEKHGEFELWRAKQPPERVAKDIDLSTKWLMTQLETDSKLGLVGFCFGGGRALESLARNPEAFGAAVCFYGTRFNPSLGAGISSVPLLFLLGDNDPLCPVQLVQETRLRSKNPQNFIVKVYPGRGHAFAHRPQSAEEDDDAEDAFSAMQTWLQDHLM